MANIILVTLDKSHSSVSHIYDLLSLAHNVTLENIDDVESPDMMSYDLIVTTRFKDDLASGNKLLECFNQGKPVMTSTIGGTPVGSTSLFDMSYLAGISSGIHVLTASGRTVWGGKYFLEPENWYKTVDMRNNLSFTYSIIPPFCPAAKIDCPLLGLTSTALPSVATILTCEKGSTNLYGGKTPARYAYSGFLYGAGLPFAQLYIDGILKIIDWLLEPVSLSEISGITTLNGEPFQQNVVAVANDINNPTLLGSTLSDPTTGEYSITTTYNKPVMVFTMQDYGDKWKSSLALNGGDTVHPTTANGFFYKVIQAGSTGNSEPNWPTDAGATVTDGGVIYTAEILLKPEIAGYKTPTPIS